MRGRRTLECSQPTLHRPPLPPSTRFNVYLDESKTLLKRIAASRLRPVVDEFDDIVAPIAKMSAGYEPSSSGYEPVRTTSRAPRGNAKYGAYRSEQAAGIRDTMARIMANK